MTAFVLFAIILQVAAVGAQVSPREVWAVVARPMWILRTALAMFVGPPLLAVGLARSFDSPREMNAAMLVLAICAAAPLLPGKLVKLGIDAAHDTALTIVSVVLAIAIVPPELRLLGAWHGRDVTIGSVAVARVLVVTVILPLAAGMLVNVVAGRRALRAAQLASTAGALLLAFLLVLMLAAQISTLFELLRHSLPVIALFASGSLAIGHALGGPEPHERVSLAVATVTRHPGLAILIGTANAPKATPVSAAILGFVLGTALAAIPYLAWQKRRLAGLPPPLVTT